MRVLLVEDSERLRRSISDGLRKSGFAVDVSADGEEGLHLARTESYDAIVLDIMLPKLDGLEVLQRLRDGGNDTHVLLLTARDTIADRVIGLRAGADDYLVKPFAFEELLAGLRRWFGGRIRTSGRGFRLENWRLIRGRNGATGAGADFAFAARICALEFLAMRRGQVVTRTEIESHIYDMQAELMSNVIDSAVCALRRKIDLADEPSLIQTRRGMGYVLDESDAS